MSTSNKLRTIDSIFILTKKLHSFEKKLCLTINKITLSDLYLFYFQQLFFIVGNSYLCYL